MNLLFIVSLFAALLTALIAAGSTSSSPQYDNDNSRNACRAPLVLPTIPLHNGLEMPLLQLGTAQLINQRQMSPDVPSNFIGMIPERAYRQIELALQNGVRAFDTAHIYRSQPVLAAVLGEWFRTGRLVRRQDVWITTKIFHPDATSVSFGISHMPTMHQMTPDEIARVTRRHLEESLHELRLGYVDLMLLHWPSGKGLGSAQDNRQRRLAAWNVLQDAYDKGWAQAIGVSNWAPKHIEQLKQDGARILPMVNQFESSVTLQYKDILQYCLDNKIVPQAYSPLGRGILQLPQFVRELAKKYNKDVGQIVFRYLYQTGYALTYLTNNATRMVSNTEIFDFELDPAEMEQLNALNQDDGGWGLPSPHELD